MSRAVYTWVTPSTIRWLTLWSATIVWRDITLCIYPELTTLGSRYKRFWKSNSRLKAKLATTWGEKNFWNALGSGRRSLAAQLLTNYGVWVCRWIGRGNASRWMKVYPKQLWKSLSVSMSQGWFIGGIIWWIGALRLNQLCRIWKWKIKRLMVICGTSATPLRMVLVMWRWRRHAQRQCWAIRLWQ